MLNIADLQRELKLAEIEYANAGTARQRAQAIEQQWLDEVESLRKLLKVREQRASGNVEPPREPVANLPIPTAETNSGAPGTKTAWIKSQIVASGDRGIAPRDIWRAATAEGIAMHPNYPYDVTKKLKDKGEIRSRGGKFFAVRDAAESGGLQ